MKKIFIGLILLAQGAYSQVNLIKDIRSGATGSALSGFVNYNNKLYFKANDGTNGSELWRSDGTTAGTVMFADYNTGSGGFNPSNLVELNGKLYFSGLTATYGSEIYSFDGTNISIAADIKTGSSSSSPGFILEMGGDLYFRAQEATTSTYRLYKMNSLNSYNVVDNSLLCGLSAAKLGTKVLFAAGTVSGNTQLYSTDGTTATLVKTINPSGTSSLTEFYTAPVLGKMFFQATDGTNGKELWVSDGTAAGTVMLVDINSGIADSSPSNFYEYNGKVYFTANDGTNGAELWVTDGTAVGTQMLKNINTAVSTGSSPGNFYAFNNKLYFAANDGATGTELWRTDGTSAGTQLVFDINSGSGNSSPTDLISFNGDLYLAADNGTTGKELFKISAGTLGLEKLITNNLKVYPNPSNGKIYFSNQMSGKYKVYTYAGNIMTTGDLKNQKELQLKLPNGNYILLLENGGEKKSFNIVVKN